VIEMLSSWPLLVLLAVNAEDMPLASIVEGDFDLGHAAGVRLEMAIEAEVRDSLVFQKPAHASRLGACESPHWVLAIPQAVERSSDFFGGSWCFAGVILVIQRHRGFPTPKESGRDHPVKTDVLDLTGQHNRPEWRRQPPPFVGVHGLTSGLCR